jgi:hypothetical protein
MGEFCVVMNGSFIQMYGAFIQTPSPFIEMNAAFVESDGLFVVIGTLNEGLSATFVMVCGAFVVPCKSAEYCCHVGTGRDTKT